MGLIVLFICSAILPAKGILPHTFFPSILFQEVALQNPGKNIIVSGTSLMGPLSLLLLASSQECKEEIAEALGYIDPADVLLDFAKIVYDLNYMCGSEFLQHSRLYVKKLGDIDKSFIFLSDNMIDAEIVETNFEQSDMIAINDWVMSATGNRSKTMFQPEDAYVILRAILVNIAYFAESWDSVFKNHKTMARPFYLVNNSAVMVPTMVQTTVTLYVDSTLFNAQFLKIPFKHEMCWFLVVIPYDYDGINKLVDHRHDMKTFTDVVRSMTMTYAKVYLPRYKFQYETNLTHVFEKMDIKKIFEPGDRLSSIYARKYWHMNQEIHLNIAKQITLIDLNEKGSLTNTLPSPFTFSPMTPPAPSTARTKHIIEVDVNKPFYFEIVCGSHALFNGIVVDPRMAD